MSDEVDLFTFSEVVEDTSYWLQKKPENSRILRLMQYKLNRLAEISSNKDINFLADFLDSFINRLWNNLAVDFTYQSGSPGRKILLSLIKKIGKELECMATQIRERKEYHPVLLQLSNLYQKSLSEIRKKEDTIEREETTIGKIANWNKVPIELNAFCHVSEESGAVTQSVYTLAGGSPSDYFFDVDKIMSKPEYVGVISDYFAKEIGNVMSHSKIDKLAFIEKDVGTVGALPLMSLIISKTKVNACIVRLRKQIPIGKIKCSQEVELKPGEVVAIVSDVATAGEGIIEVANAIREKGAITPFAFVLYDREQGAKETLAQNGILLKAVTTHAELAKLGLVPPSKGPILDERIPIPPSKIRRYSEGVNRDVLKSEKRITISFEH